MKLAFNLVWWPTLFPAGACNRLELAVYLPPAGCFVSSDLIKGMLFFRLRLNSVSTELYAH